MTTTAELWGETLILPNYESEAETYAPVDVANHLYNVMDWDGDTGWSTLAWLQNAVDWSPLHRDPVLLQIFQKDNQWAPDQIKQMQADCVFHARVQEGFTYVGVTFQVNDAQPNWYDLAGSHSVFPGNLINHGEWGTWFP